MVIRVVNSSTKHIGIVACSAEGAALCYRSICVEGQKWLGRYSHPEVTMHTHPLIEYMRYIESGDWQGVANLMLSSTRNLARAGADFAICPDNTIHQAFSLLIEESPLPWLHIADVVAEEAEGKEYTHVGILGTSYLMEGPVYPDKLGPRGIQYSIPKEDQRKLIDHVIFNELVDGLLTGESRAYFAGVIGWLKDRGCDAVVLGCTEIPLLISEEDSPLPTLDSTRLLARAALKEATR